MATWVYALTETQYSPIYNYDEPLTSVYWDVEHSLDGTSWNTIDVSGSSSQWFCRIITTTTGYSGTGAITWQLQKSADGETGWSNIGSLVASNVVFTGTSAQPLYATSDGSATGNVDWQDNFTGSGYYRVTVTLTY